MGCGFRKSPRSSNLIFPVRSLHKAVVPDTPWSRPVTTALDEGCFYVISDNMLLFWLKSQ